MKKYMVYVLIVFMCLVCSIKVDALTIEKTTRPTTTSKTQTTTKAACSISDRAEINKLAYAVTASYEFATDANGKVSFNMSVYNITGDIYVIIKSDQKYDQEKLVFPGETRGGTYTWNVQNLDTIINYKLQ